MSRSDLVDPTTCSESQRAGGTKTDWLGAMAQDLRQSLRSFRRRPLLSLVIVAMIALGIGATTAAFSFVHGVLLKPLPYPEAERLVNLFRIDPDITGDNPTPVTLSGLYSVPMPVFFDWRDQSQVFSSVGAYCGAAFIMTEDERPSYIFGVEASSGVFSALGVQPLLGRPLIARDDRIGEPGAVVLGHQLWQSSFGADPLVIGRELVLSQTTYTIVGVMPAGFSFPSQGQQLWTTFSEERKDASERNSGFLQVIARLDEGVSLSQARNQMDALALGMGDAHPEENELGIGVYPRVEIVAAPARNSVLLALGVGCLVLLIACANIAGLLLVRANERRKELSLRAALGAGHGRLVAQMLTECGLLALVGGALGCLLATANLQALLSLLPVDIPRSGEIAVDFKVVAFAVAMTLLTGILTGVLPALRSARTSIAEVMQKTGRGFTGSGGRGSTQAVLVVAQIALSFMMLTCATLFTKSFVRMASAERGFDASNIVSMPVSPSGSSLSSPQEVRDFYATLTQQLQEIPGVEEIGTISQLPFVSGLSFPPVEVETAAGIEEDIIHGADATPAYLKTMSIQIVKGRNFSEADREGSLPVALVNQAMVRKYWPGEDPIGRRLRINSPEEEWFTVVGVIGDVNYRAGMDIFPEFLVPFAQEPSTTEWVVVKTGIDPASVIPAIREALWSVDPDLAAWANVFADQIDNSSGLAVPRFGAALLIALAGIALVLAIMGIYGMLAFAVSERTPEFGIRMILGAENRSILQGVLSRGLRLSIAGLGLGTVLVLLCFQLLRGWLHGISPTDPVTLIEMALLLVAATTAASYLPAWRATTVNPVDALRWE